MEPMTLSRGTLVALLLVFAGPVAHGAEPADTGTKSQNATKKTGKTKKGPSKITASISLGSMFGTVWVRVTNRDDSDWHNVRVCVNSEWCSDPIERIRPCKGDPSKDSRQLYSDCTKEEQDAGHMSKSLNWFIERPRDPKQRSDFKDGRGVQNRYDLPIDTVSVTSDEGAWEEAF